MTANELVKGKSYRIKKSYLGKYEGSYVTRSYFEDIKQTRSIKVHQFFGSNGWTWMADWELSLAKLEIA